MCVCVCVCVCFNCYGRCSLGFLGSSVIKNLPARQRHMFDPWVGKIPWRRKRQTTPIFLLGKICGQSSLVGYSPWMWLRLHTCKTLFILVHFYFTKINSKWIINLNVKCKIIKLLADIMRENLDNLEHGDDFRCKHQKQDLWKNWQSRLQ